MRYLLSILILLFVLQVPAQNKEEARSVYAIGVGDRPWKDVENGTLVIDKGVAEINCDGIKFKVHIDEDNKTLGQTKSGAYYAMWPGEVQFKGKGKDSILFTKQRLSDTQIMYGVIPYNNDKPALFLKTHEKGWRRNEY